MSENYEQCDIDYKPWLLGGILLLIIFLAIFSVGIYLLSLQIKASRYDAVDAVVIDYKIMYENAKDSQFAKESYYYVVEYEVNGQKYETTCDTPASRYDYPNDIGKIITVYVNSNDPSNAVFNNSTHILLTVLCLAMPLGGFVGAAFVLRKARNIKKRISLPKM